MPEQVPKKAQVNVLKNIGRIFMWFFGMLGLLLVAIVIAAFIPDYKNYVYFGVLVLFIGLRALFIFRMRARVQKNSQTQQKTHQ